MQLFHLKNDGRIKISQFHSMNLSFYGTSASRNETVNDFVWLHQCFGDSSMPPSRPIFIYKTYKKCHYNHEFKSLAICFLAAEFQ